MIIWVDDSRDIEVAGSHVSVPGNLSEHTWGDGRTLGDREPVADPSLWEGDSLGSETSEVEVGNGSVTSRWSEVDGAGSAVLVDKVNGVGGSNGSSESCNDSSETHVDSWWYLGRRCGN